MPPTVPASPLRRALNAIYDAAAVASALCLVGILLVIVGQMVARWSGVSFPGSSEYAGYLMAAASFLAFAHALNRGAHIRVNLLLNALGSRKHWAEVLSMGIASAAAGYIAWYSVRLVYWSWKLGDISQGQDEMQMWIVQIPVAFGAVLLAVCFIDNFISLVATGRDNIVPDVTEQSFGE